jgi:prepilin-type processing-associated H-X9-DG protein
MAYWQRGTSNQLVFSEKHIPAHALRPTQHVRAEQSRWNGSYVYSGRGEYAHNVARVVWDRDVFASSPKQPETALPPNGGPHADVAGITGGGLEGRFTLGSSHPGTVNMLLGDGSVRGVSKTTQSRLMWDLTNAVDGDAASLP